MEIWSTMCRFTATGFASFLFSLSEEKKTDGTLTFPSLMKKFRLKQVFSTLLYCETVLLNVLMLLSKQGHSVKENENGFA